MQNNFDIDFILNKIKHLQIEKKVNNSALAKKIGVSDQTVRNYFLKRTKIDLETLIKITSALDIPIEDFFNRDKKQNSDNDFFYEFMEHFHKEIEIYHKLHASNVTESIFNEAYKKGFKDIIEAIKNNRNSDYEKYKTEIAKLKDFRINQIVKLDNKSFIIETYENQAKFHEITDQFDNDFRTYFYELLYDYKQLESETIINIIYSKNDLAKKFRSLEIIPYIKKFQKDIEKWKGVTDLIEILWSDQGSSSSGSF